jgi:hypothetical protein
MAAGFAEEAITSFQRLVELAPWLSDGAWALAAAYHMAGDRERSREWAGKAAGSGGTVFFVAYYYAATGEADAMFEALEGPTGSAISTFPSFQATLSSTSSNHTAPTRASSPCSGE